jgi:hypothetical protein
VRRGYFGEYLGPSGGEKKSLRKIALKIQHCRHILRCSGRVARLGKKSTTHVALVGNTQRNESTWKTQS